MLGFFFRKKRQERRRESEVTPPNARCRLPSWREDAALENAAEEYFLTENGLLDPGQPTRQAHERYIARMEAPFTPEERRMIRSLLFPTPEEEPLG